MSKRNVNVDLSYLSNVQKQVTENLGNKGLGNKASLIYRAGHCN